MSTVNMVVLMGYLGADPESRSLPSGDAVCNFRIATTERWTDKGTREKREATEWHSITAFGRQAEIVTEYLRKGKLVHIVGQLRTRKWSDKNGVERYSTEVVMRQMQMVSTGKREDVDAETGEIKPRAQAAKKPAQREAGLPGGGHAEHEFDDDIPF